MDTPIIPNNNPSTNKINVLLMISLIVLIITLSIYIFSRILNIFGINFQENDNSQNIKIQTKIGIGSTA